MAICRSCKREMLQNVSCVAMPFVDAPDREPIRYGLDLPTGSVASGPCGDCGTPIGGFHHLNCDIERHPVTSEQVICRSFLRRLPDGSQVRT